MKTNEIQKLYAVSRRRSRGYEAYNCRPLFRRSILVKVDLRNYVRKNRQRGDPDSKLRHMRHLLRFLTDLMNMDTVPEATKMWSLQRALRNEWPLLDLGANVTLVATIEDALDGVCDMSGTAR